MTCETCILCCSCANTIIPYLIVMHPCLLSSVITAYKCIFYRYIDAVHFQFSNVIIKLDFYHLVFHWEIITILDQSIALMMKLVKNVLIGK